MSMMQRRHLVLGGLALAAPLVGVGGASAGVQDGLLFEVSREGRPIGRHRVLLSGDAGRLTTSIEIDLEVRLAFVRLYSYRHRNREVWDGASFVEFVSETDDNGERHRVRAVADADGILVDGTAGRQLVPFDHMPTTWWSRRLVEAGRWIDTQSGRILRSSVTEVGRERLIAADAEVEADRLRLSGDLDLDIWYAEERWVGLEFRAQADGSRIGYKLVATGPAAAASTA
jgi:hypothetical protein